MGRHTFRKQGAPLTRQEIINKRRDMLAEHRKQCKNKKCTCELAEAGLPSIPNE